MLKLTAVLALLASPAFGLTDLEIGAFRAGPVSCISDDGERAFLQTQRPNPFLFAPPT